MRVVVVSSCSSSKRRWPASRLGPQDFQSGNAEQRAADLAPFGLPARDQYTGAQHEEVKKGVDILRSATPGLDVTWVVVSAGFGVLRETDPVVPYEYSFIGMSRSERMEWSRTLGIEQRLLPIVRGDDVLRFFLLSPTYTEVIGEAAKQAAGLTVVFGRCQGSKRQLGIESNLKALKHWQSAGWSVTGVVALKGRLFRLVCLGLSSLDSPVEQLGEWLDDPPRCSEFVDPVALRELAERNADRLRSVHGVNVLAQFRIPRR